MFEILFTMAGICFLFGLVYPVGAVLFYPIYRLLGGDLKFGEYVRSL